VYRRVVLPVVVEGALRAKCEYRPAFALTDSLSRGTIHILRKAFGPHSSGTKDEGELK
jgi:hypothetical protein